MAQRGPRDVDYRNRRSGPATGPSILLGVASLGLGVTSLTRPREMAEALGLQPRDEVLTVMRAVGLRELLVVPGLLARRHPRRWLWMRVAGDAVDAALLIGAARRRPRSALRLGGAAAALAGVTALDVTVAMRAQRARITGGEASVRARAAVTVRVTPQQAYAVFHDFERLPDFMQHLEAVKAGSDGTSRWTARAPGGRRITWNARVIADRPGDLIAWRSEPGARISHRGSVRFAPAPGDRGTVVTVDLEYEPIGGAAGSLLARMLGDEPVQQVKDDLRRFKQIVETGEIARSDASPEGTRALRQAVQRPAQPARRRAG